VNKFYKYHGLGNDYLVIDPAHAELALSVAAVRLLCDRHYGIGSDGILYGPFWGPDNIPAVKIFNPDGSEAEKSGNGVRIFSRYLCEAGYVTGREFSLRTAGGVVAVEVLDEKAWLLRVDMGTATFASDQIPVAGEKREVVAEKLAVGEEMLTVTCVSLGNPHCVVSLPVVSPAIARRLGPQIERHPAFPNRINVQFMEVLDRETIQIEIWERGAGYTLASGSSSCAAAAAARRLGLVGDRVEVRMPGGNIQVQFTAAGRILMTGPVAKVCEGEIAADLVRAIKQA